MDLVASLKSGHDKVCVVGLGYVGLPLALAFGKYVPTVGFDVSKRRIETLNSGKDLNGEVPDKEFELSKHVRFTDDPEQIRGCRFIVVAVPTPITESRQPDLSFLDKASTLVGRYMQKHAIVVYESTVYPGVTEEFCLPILLRESKYAREEIQLGYSPERINPGDQERTVENILKIVSGETKDLCRLIGQVYSIVVKAGVYEAKSIKSAEAAKVIENTQRDLNIALVNELSLVFDRLDIDTQSVLEAAGTKWNFIKMSPGLVGGHCIGVDPYYLTHKAESVGYFPQVILAGRRINDGMGKYIAEKTVKKMIHGNKTVKDAKVLVLGITFKENVSDIRNSRVIDVIRELETFGADVSVFDPLADKEEVRHEYGINLADYNPDVSYDAIVLCVSHDKIRKMFPPEKILSHLASNSKSMGVLVDVKWMYQPEDFEGAAVSYWRL